MQVSVFYTIFTLFVMMMPFSAAAQTAAGCVKGDLGNPPRIVYQCQGGVILEAEAAAVMGIIESGPNERPTDVRVLSDAVFIEITPDSGAFQIRTPHAIAAVRGTVYVVDVSADRTDVFVVEGEVSVTHLDGSDRVELTAGLGVDVTPGEPLVVRQWPEERVRNLLARFGR